MSARPWNETNPEWWKAQVEERGEIAWTWLVNEWAARSCYERGCQESAVYLVTTMGGKVGACERHAQWYRAKGPDIYPVEPIVEAVP